MPFPDGFLQDLRDRVKVSEIVSQRMKLRRDGREFRAVDDKSLTINDGKKLWWDHAKNEGGDIFDWCTKIEGQTFPEAVERIAKVAGVTIPADRERTSGRRTNGSHARPLADGNDGTASTQYRPGAAADATVADNGGFSDGQGAGRRSREIFATYDYCDPQGSLIYQVCRIEGTSDTGKPYKTFIQRRPATTEGHWIWGLGAGEYVQTRKGDWYQLTKDREKWPGPRASFDGVEHTLYRLVELREAEPEEPVFITEGEKDCETLVEWGFAATTNSGGAKHWRGQLAEMFRNRHVVIAIDNDDPGRERAGIVGRSLRGIASSVRVLDITTVWPDAPKGADVTDWKRQREGSPEELREIVDRLPEWRAPPRESKFGLVMWSDQDQPGEEYEYLIEDLIPEREPVIIYGETGSGKSFYTVSMAMAGATGTTFFGRRIIKPFGVVYCAYEAGKGFRQRMRAYRQMHFKNQPLTDLPLAVLTRPADLWSEAVNINQLVEEILWIAEERFGGVPLGAVVIDTHNAATTGASEIDSKEVSVIRQRYRQIMDQTKAGVWIVSHKNAAGKHRGNEQLFNNIDTAIDISRRVKIVDKQPFPERDALGRQLRTARIAKQREGEDGTQWDFVLANETVGTNKYGRPRVSCVAVEVMSEAEASEGSSEPVSPGISLNSERATILRALKTAIENHGQPAPAGLGLPRAIAKVVHGKFWKEEYLKIAPDAETAQGNTINSRLRRASEKFQEERIIGRSNPWIWITGRPVKNVIGPVAGRDENPFPGRAEPPLPSDITDFL